MQNFLQGAKNILIVVRKAPDLDTIAASLALYLSLSQKGKQVKVICPDKMTVAESSLFAVDKISDELISGKNLTISFPYVEGSIEKVSYNIDNNKFNLVIEPRDNGSLFNPETVEFSKSGDLNFDLIISIGVANLSDLGKFQNDLVKLFEQQSSIVISDKNGNFQPGTIKIISPQSMSISEIVTLILSKINFPFEQEIADNLLKGIKERTKNFSQAGADSFEAAAICLRKMNRPVQTTQEQQFSPARNIQDQRKAPPDWLKPKIFRSGASSDSSDDRNSGTIL